MDPKSGKPPPPLARLAQSLESALAARVFSADAVRHIARSVAAAAKAEGRTTLTATAAKAAGAPETGLEAEARALLQTMRVADIEDPSIVEVLVVEDATPIAELVRHAVATPGRKVHVAPTAAEGERILRERPIRLVLLDLILPDRDGRDLLTQIRSTEAWADIPVIILSAATSHAAKAECILLGADAFLRKPTHPVVLRNAVSRWISGRHSDDGAGAEDGSASEAPAAAPEAPAAAPEPPPSAPAAPVVPPEAPAAAPEPPAPSAPAPPPSREAPPAAPPRQAPAQQQASPASGAPQTPAAPAPTPPAAAPPAASVADPPPPRPGAKVILVEDDRVTASLVKHRLTREGLDVTHFLDGGDAHAWLTTNTWDIVILDVKVPGMDGFEMLQRLSEMPGERPGKVLMLTAMGAESDVVRGLRYGANDYMLKPFSPNELVARVRRLLASVDAV